MRFLPVFLDISLGIVALIGGGAAAKSKLRLLRSAGAHVRWYAGDVIEPLIEIDREGFIRVPEGAGIGFSVSREKVKQYATAVEAF